MYVTQLRLLRWISFGRPLGFKRVSFVCAAMLKDHKIAREPLGYASGAYGLYAKGRTIQRHRSTVGLRSQHGILEYWILDSEASGILDIGFRKPPDIGYWIPKASRYWILIIQSPDGQPSTRTVLSSFGQSGDLAAALDSPNFGGQDLLCQCAVGTVGFGERRSHQTFASGGFPGRSKGFVAS